MSTLRIAFAGDRDLAPPILQYLIDCGIPPIALLLPNADRASHAIELKHLCVYLEPGVILEGHRFRQRQGMEVLTALQLDYIICVHFPYIIPEEVLEIPRYGVLNLHPAYLPYNRGWNTPTWAILENTPIGATLHFMDTGVDTGDIVYRRKLDISPGDTANTLYRRLKSLEIEVFKEAWPQLVAGLLPRRAQEMQEGATHKRSDLLSPTVQQIDLEQTVVAADLLKQLRALTTNRLEEAAYYVSAGKRYRVQLVIHED